MIKRLRIRDKVVKRIIIGIIALAALIFACNRILNNIYEQQRKKITAEDRVLIDEVISLAEDKVGLEYVWGGKGEIMTEERLDELISYYGEEEYPLDREEYIGKQAFDCSGLVYWLYKETSGVAIGYSTDQQEEALHDYKISMKDIQPGDLIYVDGHVVLYIGDGKIIDASSSKAYPKGGVKKESVIMYSFGRAYRPVSYIKENK